MGNVWFPGFSELIRVSLLGGHKRAFNQRNVRFWVISTQRLYNLLEFLGVESLL
jgi:hypothetical protein